MPPQTRRVLRFVAPRTVSVETEPRPEPGPGEVLVETALTAVSPGTEKLVYRGEAPSTLAADPEIAALEEGLDFPLTYGYAAVGEVVHLGADVPERWRHRRVFSFQPHVSHFVASPDALLPIPGDTSDIDAVLTPNVETAVNFCMDGRPMIGERVVIFGQGTVGLLTTSVLSRHPVGALYTVEPDPDRRARSEARGADRAFAPADDSALAEALDLRHADASPASEAGYEGADLIFELSGQPDVLNQALAVAGYDARIVLGSWYGTRRAPIDLGGRFHRSRVSIVSSQVSTVRPAYEGRWTKDRRMDTVLDILPTLSPGALATEPAPLEEAGRVYEELDREEGGTLQPVFRYD